MSHKIERVIGGRVFRLYDGDKVSEPLRFIDHPSWPGSVWSRNGGNWGPIPIGKEDSTIQWSERYDQR